MEEGTFHILRVSVNKNIAVACITGNTNTRNTKLSTAPPAVALNLTPSWKPLTSYQNWRGSSAGNPSPCSGYGISSRISCASPNNSHLTTARGSHFVIQTYLCLRHAEAILLQSYMGLRIGRHVTLKVIKKRQSIFCIFVTQFRCSYEYKIVCISL